MREFLCLLDAAVPYVVLLPDGSVSPDIPGEARELISWAEKRLEAVAAPIVEMSDLEESTADVVQPSPGPALESDFTADPDLFTGEEE